MKKKKEIANEIRQIKINVTNKINNKNSFCYIYPNWCIYVRQSRHGHSKTFLLLSLDLVQWGEVSDIYGDDIPKFIT